MYKENQKKPKLTRAKKINWSKAILNINLENRKKEICESNKVPELREDTFAEQLEIQHALKGWNLEQKIQWQMELIKRERKEKDKKIKKNRKSLNKAVRKYKIKYVDRIIKQQKQFLRK